MTMAPLRGITESAFEHDVAIDVHEFRTLGRCLDNAIARLLARLVIARLCGSEQ